eukprot:2461839-Pleurochrysis_carterae.AAC.1
MRRHHCACVRPLIHCDLAWPYAQSRITQANHERAPAPHALPSRAAGCVTLSTLCVSRHARAQRPCPCCACVRPLVYHVFAWLCAQSHIARANHERAPAPHSLPSRAAGCATPSPPCVLRHAYELRPRCVRLSALASLLSDVPPRAGVTAARAYAL